MKIELTELEYNEADNIAFEYFFDKRYDSLESLGKEIWINCKKYKENNSEDLSPVYKRNPFLLWEEKKRFYRVRLIKELESLDVTDKYLFDKNDLTNAVLGKKTKEHNEKLKDDYILGLKKHKKYITKVNNELNREKKEKQAEEKNNNEIRGKIQLFKKKGWSDEEIISIIPESKGFLKKNQIVKPRIGKK